MNHLLWLGIIIVTLLTVSCQINLGDSGGDPGIEKDHIRPKFLKVLVQPDTIARARYHTYYLCHKRQSG